MIGVRALVVVALFALAVRGFTSGAASADPEVAEPRLELSQLRVTPRFVRPGGVVRVDAVVVNRGAAPVHGLQLGIAVSSITAAKDWVPLDKSHPEPIAIVPPGGQVNFRATARLDAAGTVQVGLMGLAANGGLAPVGRTVRVMQPMSLLTNGVVVFLSYALAVGTGGLTLWFLARGLVPPGAPMWQPAIPAVAGAVALMVLGPSLLLTVVPAGRAPSPRTVWAAYAAVGLFAAGWVLVGAALRPSGSPWRGGAAAAVLYVSVGLLLYVGFSTATGTPPLTMLRALPTVNGVGFVVLWPLLVAQLLGLFGLHMA